MTPTQMAAFLLAHPFAITIKGSLDYDADDCWTGDEFGTEAEARAVFDDPTVHFADSFFHDSSSALYIILDGPGVHETRCIHKGDPRRRAAEDAAERREEAMMAGMAFGVDGYNDSMGY